MATKAKEQSDLAERESLAIEEALRTLMIERGVFDQAALDKQIALMDSRAPDLGAKIVARAWVDPAFKARLLKNSADAAKDFGLDLTGMPEVIVLENTPARHHLVVCTLCSCYPKAILGIPPGWYKNAAYRAKAVRNPRGVLAEFGTTLPDNVEVRVVDSTADMRYLVLPMRPAGAEGWSEERLAKLVTRDSMIGVTQAAQP
jgi:nitrile hydratase subunit alpha